MGRNRNLKTNTTFKSKEYNFSSPSERDAFLVAAGSTGAVEVKGIQATNTITFTGVPAAGDTITMAGHGSSFTTVLTYTDTLDAATNINADQILASGISTATEAAARFAEWLNAFYATNDTNYVRGSLFYMEGEVDDTTDTIVNVRFAYSGDAANAVTLATTSAAVTVATATFEGGSKIVDTSKTKTVQAISTGGGTYPGYVCWFGGIDTETGLMKAAFRDSTSSDDFALARAIPMGISLTAASEGEEFTMAIEGFVNDVQIFSGMDGRMGKPGDRLSTESALPSFLSSSDGLNQVATMVLPSGLTAGNVVYLAGGFSDPDIGGHSDGIPYPATSIRQQTRFAVTATNTLIPAGSLLKSRNSGALSEGYIISELLENGDTAADVIGVLSQDYTGNTSTPSGTVIVDGTAGAVRLYDSSGNQHVYADFGLGDAMQTGTLIYAGDGTINPTSYLTTDPTSGIAIGRVIAPIANGVFLPANDPDKNKFEVYIERSLFSTVPEVVATKTATSTVNDNTDVIFVNPAAAATITIANAANLSAGEKIVIKDTSGAASTNNITVSPAGGTIDGAATAVINTNYGTLTLISDGTNYFIV